MNYPILGEKTALIMGVINENSIAWHIAAAMWDAGAHLIITGQNQEQLDKRVKPLVATLSPALQSVEIFPCDVSSDEEINRLVTRCRQTDRQFGLEVLVHSIAYAPREAMIGRFMEVTSREAFRQTMDVSVYSLIGVTRAFKPYLRSGASVITMTYVASQVVIPNYNVMGLAKAALECGVRYLADDLGQDGIRVNAISAGPQNTLAARGIPGFRKMHASNDQRTPLGKSADQSDVASVAVFLASSAAAAITGQVLYVDAGPSIRGIQVVEK